MKLDEAIQQAISRPAAGADDVRKGNVALTEVPLLSD